MTVVSNKKFRNGYTRKSSRAMIDRLKKKFPKYHHLGELFESVIIEDPYGTENLRAWNSRAFFSYALVDAVETILTAYETQGISEAGMAYILWNRLTNAGVPGYDPEEERYTWGVDIGAFMDRIEMFTFNSRAYDDKLPLIREYIGHEKFEELFDRAACSYATVQDVDHLISSIEK